MGGIQGENLQEIRSDLEAINEPGFWSIAGSFEGSWTLARFKDVAKKEFVSEGRDLRAGQWRSSKTRDEYKNYVEMIRSMIAAGEVYQVNACRILRAKILEEGNLSGLFSRILSQNPAPFAGYLSLPDLEIASASPERFISKDGNRIISSPIKGTSATSEFLAKDRAENLMIVDLIRNDLGRICETGTVATPRLLATEKHPGLFHLVSDVSGSLKKEIALSEAITEVMPPGSISGAPKSSALRIIKSNEGERGPYCGVFGWSDGNRMELSVGIRLFWRSKDEIKFGTGAGITWDSDPESEWEETELKARRLISLTQ
ncbi:MAG: anthranilate synthase component I family protein [Candidatus Nanopelagicaceae bacterium]|nr:anthranilate synthase component I family protein [Candidatus Nanopelagicaceae bacterium]